MSVKSVHNVCIVLERHDIQYSIYWRCSTVFVLMYCVVLFCFSMGVAAVFPVGNGGQHVYVPHPVYVWKTRYFSFIACGHIFRVIRNFCEVPVRFSDQAYTYSQIPRQLFWGADRDYFVQVAPGFPTCFTHRMFGIAVKLGEFFI